jgi:hypothetical protein
MVGTQGVASGRSAVRDRTSTVKVPLLARNCGASLGASSSFTVCPAAKR